MISIGNMTLEEMRQWFAKSGYPAFRANQVYKWLCRGAGSFDEMTNLPKDLRTRLVEQARASWLQGVSKQGALQKEIPPKETWLSDPLQKAASQQDIFQKETSQQDALLKETSPREDLQEGTSSKDAERAFLGLPQIVAMQQSADGTCKYLFELADGNRIESVFMRYDYGNSLCVSSQVGCRMGCRFCASTKKGLQRNLTAGEMRGQVLAAAADQSRRAGGTGITQAGRINHIVVMGMGEPFDNYEEVSQFIAMLHEKEGLNLSLRHITVSTCGLVEGIKRFGKDYPQVNLAISLHAPTDSLRNTMMPIANKYSIDKIMAACKGHTQTTGRRITFEYALVEGVNDTDQVIGQLADLLRGTLCHVNLIPLNKVDEFGKEGTDRARARDIAERLTAAGVPATVRRSLGRDIAAACGQLRARSEQ